MNRNLYIYGGDERLVYCRDFLAERLGGGPDIHILPIPTTRDGKTLNGGGTTLYEAAENMTRGEMVLAYGVSGEFLKALEKRGVILIDAAEDSDYLERGAELTAQGAVAKIFTESRKAPRDTAVGVIGYGRIGRRLTSLLAFLGAGVCVFTSRPELCENLGRLGIKAVGNYDLPLIRAGVGYAVNPLSELDILINTAPAAVLSAEDSPNLINTRVIELASGENIPKSIRHEAMPSLPAKMFPESAGIAYGEVLLRKIRE